MSKQKEKKRNGFVNFVDLIFVILLSSNRCHFYKKPKKPIAIKNKTLEIPLGSCCELE